MTKEEINLVEMWLKKDPVRWIAGVVAGKIAGLIAIGFGILASAICGKEIWTTLKAAAIPVLGADAMNLGFHLVPILTGLVVLMVIFSILGMVYAHFTSTNYMPALLGIGFTWGAFSWIFIQNLFGQSFRELFVSHISSGAAFFFWLAFGLSLSIVAVVDRTIRR